MSETTEKNATTAMGYFWKAREYITPTLKKTAFLEKGVLTPDEFVRAGDELVYRCPTWSWATDIKTSKIKSYLPIDKQYLITRNVPCRDRVAMLERNMDIHNLQDDDDEEDGGDWMVSSMPKERSIEDEFDVLDEDGEIICNKSNNDLDQIEKNNTINDNNNTDDDEYADMADFELEDDNIIMDDNAATAANAATAKVDNYNNNDDHIVKVRTYDMSITYDKYYQTPRVWLSGKSCEGNPLTAKETMEDVISDYANKTVTMEAHPYLSGPHASIHPCQHGKVMKVIVQNLMNNSNSNNNDGDDEEQKNGPSVETYLFIFLKFVSSMIPTINYDFTMDVTADTTVSKH